ncbi:hypothetical protein LTR67_006384 [Exophiala xenobiotica]
MIGDCGFVSSILFYMLNDRLATLVPDFNKSITKSLADYPRTKTLLTEGYGIGEQQSPENITISSRHRILPPVQEIAKAWPGKAYVYHFNQTNLWDGQLKGESTHTLDVAVIFFSYEHNIHEVGSLVAVFLSRHNANKQTLAQR